MSRLFVDTSALIAHLDADDPRRAAVDDVIEAHVTDELVTHGYVVAETLAVARRRFGVSGVRTLIDEMLPLLTIVTVDGPVFRGALDDFRASIDTATSFVDRLTLAVMRAESIDSVLALDPDLAAPGVRLLPGS